MRMRLHLDGVVDRDICEAAREICGLVEVVLRRRKEHDVVHGRERVAGCVAQIAVGGLPERGQLRAVLHVQRDAVRLRHNVAGADLLTVEIDGDPLEAVVDDEIERRVFHLPAAGKLRDIDHLTKLLRRMAAHVLVKAQIVIIRRVIVVHHIDGHIVFRRQEDDIIAVVQREVQLIEAGVVKDIVLIVVDKNVERRDLGLLVCTEPCLDGVTVIEQPVHEFRVPVAVLRGRDADGRDAVAAAVDERDGKRYLFFSAGGKGQAQKQRQRKGQIGFQVFHRLLLLFQMNCFNAPAPPWTISHRGSTPNRRSGQRCRWSQRCSTPARLQAGETGSYPDTASCPAGAGFRTQNRPAKHGRAAV